jgi:hypothetical protein
MSSSKNSVLLTDGTCLANVKFVHASLHTSTQDSVFGMIWSSDGSSADLTDPV